MTKGKVYLIGAGPGDPDLITVKGLRCINNADTVVYDRLADPRLLKKCRRDAEMIYVGKGPDRHTLKQEEINQLLVDKAKEGKTIARLKGGDPFVFGRGGEEAEVLVENQIPFEIVPGITSAIAVPAYAGIPVTHRDYTSSVSIITGNEDPTKEDSNINWEHIGNGTGTLVFLMGMGNLDKIATKLIANGRPASTPVALIRWGTRPEQKTLTGTLENIAQKAQAAEFKNPAIILVGGVVNLREKLAWLEKKPLFGKRIIVTRAREQASVLSRKISELGGEPYEFPTIKIVPPDDFSPLDDAIKQISSYQWVIFTSVNGVKIFARRLHQLGGDIRDLKGVNLCAIGPKTRLLLENYGLRVDYVPVEFRAEAIVAGLKNKLMPGDKVLLPRADIARKILPKSLKELGASVTEITTYKTVTEKNNTGELVELLKSVKVDMVTFTSSSTVRNFVSLLDTPDIKPLMTGVLVACIGPITARTAEEHGLQVSIQASEYTIEGLLKAIMQTYDQ
ncbi:MAG: uroporphyrinogen-III C-methyltransferase [Firmicutes bacterium]|nr:uroporphyrinogen-III C-methyltransferase [Bacillota bacterium]